jgi:hypothetical protein
VGYLKGGPSRLPVIQYQISPPIILLLFTCEDNEMFPYWEIIFYFFLKIQLKLMFCGDTGYWILYTGYWILDTGYWEPRTLSHYSMSSKTFGSSWLKTILISKF